ncbi:aromatic ring-hydroxylating oxygenase subunit alpha [Nostoc sp.]|uniref:aromatic ring-hydroxylating oxygenase subunit alpha n=1 Tax=Nostoc sp. TaxID=1180 RepID=UPI002FF9C0F6
MTIIDSFREKKQTVQDLLQADTRPVPDVFLEQSMPDLGTADIPREVFFSKEYHELELEKLWKKVWQSTCREEDIPKVGDYVVYDIGDSSVIIVRNAPQEIRAFYNVCLHRGTQLEVSNGHVPVFQCPFHGWTWKLDGTLTHIPCKWDFEHIDQAAFRLPELKVATWQGIVFVNFDLNCEPLESYLENIPEQFNYIPFPLKDRFTAVHIVKVMPANWKVTLEAFIESYHFLATHPQLVAFVGDTIAQNDVYKRHSRIILPTAVQSPHLNSRVDHQALAEKLAVFEGDDPAMVNVPEGMTARSYAAEAARQRQYQRLGVDCSNLLDTEILDVMSYLIFPNLLVTPSLQFPFQSRFLPNSNDPDSSIMEVRMLLPCPLENRPPSAKIHKLGLDDSWTIVPGFEKVGVIFDQDTSNLHRLQRGLKASAKSGITLGKHQESIIRHFHQVLDYQLQS